ncbi:hypothetical protein [Streptomyces sp. NPDC004324]
MTYPRLPVTFWETVALADRSAASEDMAHGWARSSKDLSAGTTDAPAPVRDDQRTGVGVDVEEVQPAPFDRAPMQMWAHPTGDSLDWSLVARQLSVAAHTADPV